MQVNANPGVGATTIFVVAGDAPAKPPTASLPMVIVRNPAIGVRMRGDLKITGTGDYLSWTGFADEWETTGLNCELAWRNHGTSMMVLVEVNSHIGSYREKGGAILTRAAGADPGCTMFFTPNCQGGSFRSLRFVNNRVNVTSGQPYNWWLHFAQYSYQTQFVDAGSNQNHLDNPTAGSTIRGGDAQNSLFSLWGGGTHTVIASGGGVTASGWNDTGSTNCTTALRLVNLAQMFQLLRVGKDGQAMAMFGPFDFALGQPARSFAESESMATMVASCTTIDQLRAVWEAHWEWREVPR
jgi:hypothetical protein